MSKSVLKQAVRQLRRGPVVGEVIDRAMDTVRGPEGSASPAPVAMSADETRIVPPPPPPDSSQESFDVWGFDDTEFQISPRGHVVLTGNRYSLCGDEMPNFLPWIRGIMEIPIDIDDVNPPAYPPAIPKPKRKKGFTDGLKAIMTDEHFTDDAEERLRHGHGHTQEEMYAIKYGSLTRVPDLVVWPTEQSHVEGLVELAGKHDVVLVPYGGGTNVTDALRCPPSEKRFICSVDMRRMNRILWIDPTNRMACIQAGAVGRHIMSQLATYGFTMGHEPDSVEFSTLGGWVATHASGMKKNKYGNIEDIVLDVTAVTASGTLTRKQIAPRESIGTDPKRMMFGSEGNYGIITSAVVKLFPLPQCQEHGSVLFRTFEDGVAFMFDLTRNGTPPASIRLVDNVQFQFGMALKPASHGWKARKSKLEKLFVTKLKGFDPDKMVACTIVFEGTHEEVALQQDQVYRIASRHGGMKAGAENGKKGYELTFGIAYIRDFVMNFHVIAESFETSVPWSQTISLCDRVKKRLFDEHQARGLPGKPFVTCRVTQVYPTGVAVYFYFAFSYKGVENPTKVYLELEHIAREEILAAGGSISHHHGVGKIRKAFLPDIMSEGGLSFNREAKRAFDPQGIFGTQNHQTDDSAQ
ncbi:MAG TPA: oxidase [Myxococcales bacterium]|nr:oxidase [Myxococcales bacterium]HAN32433.1 oxidase [Myxococcales bacterium]